MIRAGWMASDIPAAKLCAFKSAFTAAISAIWTCK
jgi:hypothetical protein